MSDAIGAAAVRSLSVDIANLSAKVAVQQAILEDLLQQATYIDPSDWFKQESAKPGELPGYLIPEAHYEPLRTLLGSLKSLQ